MEEFDEELCMINSYLLLTGKKSLEQFMMGDDIIYFIYDPEHSSTKKEIKAYDSLINYFVSTEEYEKCAELLELKKINQIISSEDVI